MPFKNPHPLYNTWISMRQRCRNPKVKQWHDYGGRGINVCDRWDDFHMFVQDMGPRPEGHSLDRIDNDADYSPENCRWTSRKGQQRNRRNTRRVVIDGEEYVAADLADLAGVKALTIVERAGRGLPYSEVVAPAGTREEVLLKARNASAILRSTKTHCVHGHEYTPENTSYAKTGARICKACRRAKSRREWAAAQHRRSP